MKKDAGEGTEQGVSDKVEQRWVPMLVPPLFYGHCGATILVQPVSAIGRSDEIDPCTQDRKCRDHSKNDASKGHHRNLAREVATAETECKPIAIKVSLLRNCCGS